MSTRREFLGFCVVGGAVACVPDAPERAGWRDGREPSAPDAQPSAPTADAGQNEQRPPDGGTSTRDPDAGQPDPIDAGTIDAGEVAPPDAGCDVVMMHDTYAQALYLDRTLGPLTGTIFVDYVLANQDVELEFWHGHGGRSHMFTLRPEHFDALKRGERVMVTTTEVDSHQHELFIDPVDPEYRVPGSPDREVPVC